MTSSSDFRVTLLGTGVPTPRPDRFGPSTLVEVGNQRLLIDASAARHHGVVDRQRPSAAQRGDHCDGGCCRRVGR